MINIGPLITMLRKECNMTQKDLADHLNLSTGTISNYENSVHYPDLVTVNNLADLFHVTTDYLLGRTQYRCSPELLEQYRAESTEVRDLTNRLLHLDSTTRHAVESIMEYMTANKPE